MLIIYEKSEQIRYHFHLENLPKQTTCEELIHKEEADIVDFRLHPSGNRLATMKMEHRIPASCRFLFYAPKLTQDGKNLLYILHVTLLLQSPVLL